MTGSPVFSINLTYLRIRGKRKAKRGKRKEKRENRKAEREKRKEEVLSVTKHGFVF